MNRLADITIKSILSSGFALGLAIISLFSSAAKANDWNLDLHDAGIDSFSNTNVTTLMKVQLRAGTSEWNDDSLNISASFKGITFDKTTKALAYQEVTKDFSLNSPIRAMDFSDSIRERSEICLEKVIDKMVIDGAIGFNLSW